MSESGPASGCINVFSTERKKEKPKESAQQADLEGRKVLKDGKTIPKSKDIWQGKTKETAGCMYRAAISKAMKNHMGYNEKS